MRAQLAAAVFALGLSSPALAVETLVVSSWLPPTHHINAIAWTEWAERVKAATDGRIEVKIEYGLAPPPAQIDLVMDGAADATWLFHGYNPGRFVATQIVELPGIEASAEALSVAYWRVHEKYLEKAGEHDGLKLLGLSTHGPGVLHTRELVTNLDQVEGLKIRIGGGVSSDVGAALGMVGVNVPATRVYETVASGVADGVMIPMGEKKGLRLSEVAPYSLVMPGGFYYGSFAFIMNRDRFDALSPADQEALMSVSGEELSKLAGRAWDTGDVEGLEHALAEGNTITTASPDTLAAFQEKTKNVAGTVIERIDALGIDAIAAREELNAIATSYTP